MKKLTKILSDINFDKFPLYAEIYIAGMLTPTFVDSLTKKDYKTAAVYGITSGIFGLLAYQNSKRSIKK